MADEDEEPAELPDDRAREMADAGAGTKGWNEWVRRSLNPRSRLSSSLSTRGSIEASSGDAHMSAGTRSEAAKAEVNLLDARERRIGIIATVAELVLTAFVTVPYLFHHHKSSTSELKTNSAVHVFLIEGLVLGVILMLGTIVKRRALLGFASLLVGLWLLQVKALFLIGIGYLGFGLWLVVKGLKHANKGDRGAARGSTRGAASRPRAQKAGRSNSKPSADRSAPKPNKRYTPPKATSRPAPKKPPARAETPKS